MTRAVFGLVGLGLLGCAIEIPPHVPGPPGRRAVVVPFPGGDELGGDVPSELCSSLCPRAAPGEVLDLCHGGSLTGTMAAHRRALGETEPTWVVCYFEGD